ncbi:g12983 [Coccomyxa viridis]|uniref:G12983 protein n=1 Tax=Coccomyxa viridis TaxID=1274662 RepID=A0ABP1GEA9_9CHLO
MLLPSVPVCVLLVALPILILGGRALARILRRRYILSKQKIPYRPSTHWLLGDGDIFKADVHRAGQEWSRKLDTGIYWRRMLHHSVVVISDPELTGQVLDRSRTPHQIDKPYEPMFYHVVDETTAHPPQESHLTAATSDPLWRAVRKGTAPAFSPQNMRNAYPEVARTARVLASTLKRMGPEQAVNIDAAVQCQAFDMIGSVGFGKLFNAAADLSSEGADSCRAVEQAAQSVVNNLRNPWSWIPFTKPWWKHRGHIKRVLAVMRNLLQEVHDRGTPDPRDESLAAHLMRVRDEDGRLLPHARQWSELSVFFYAGMETTAHTIAWCIYAICQHPEVEAKVAAELDAVGLLATPDRPEPRCMEHVDLARLTYLQCVIKESIRLRPVLPVVFRRAMKDVQIGPYLFPEGTILELHTLAMNTHPHYWERPDDFVPERWFDRDAEFVQDMPASAAAKQKAGSKVEITVNATGRQSMSPPRLPENIGKVRRTLPFGAGARACIGMPLAQLMLPTTVATLLGHFHFRLATRTNGAKAADESEVWRITVQPLHGLYMHCQPRAPTQSAAKAQ